MGRLVAVSSDQLYTSVGDYNEEKPSRVSYREQREIDFTNRAARCPEFCALSDRAWIELCDAVHYGRMTADEAIAKYGPSRPEKERF